MGRLATELAALNAVFAGGGLYRANESVVATDLKLAVGLDVECVTSTRGLVLHDRSNGNAYRLKSTAGVLGVEVVT